MGERCSYGQAGQPAGAHRPAGREVIFIGTAPARAHGARSGVVRQIRQGHQRTMEKGGGHAGMRRPAQRGQHLPRPGEHQPRPPQQRQQQHQHGQAHGSRRAWREDRPVGPDPSAHAEGSDPIRHHHDACVRGPCRPSQRGHRWRLQRAADQRRKHHQQRRQDGKLEQKALRAGQPGHPASVEPGPGLPCDEPSQEGLSAGLRPAPAEATSTARAEATAKAKAGFLLNGGAGPVGRRRKPIHGAWPRHPCRGHSRNRTHPAFDSFLRSVGKSDPFSEGNGSTPDVFRYLTAFIHAWLPCRPRSTPTNSREDLSEVGRCGQTGPLAPWMAPSSPQGWVYGVSCLPTPPRLPRKPAVASAVAIDSAGAGLQALLAPHTVMVWVSDSQVGGTGHAAAWLPSSTRRRSRGSICGASTCTSSSA